MMKEKISLKCKKLVSLGIIILILGIFLQSIIVIADEPETLVYVNPASQTVAPGASFNISVNCIPGLPIKGFEFLLSFDASLLTANSVSEGDIFSGHSTFFNYTINNTAGTITNVYNLIVGTENVSDPGTLINISFTAKSTSGVSSLNISDLGVANETGYVTTNTTNGTVEIDGIPPEFTDNSPAQGYTGDSYTFNVTVTDNTDSANNLTVYVDWTHGGSSDNNTMNNMGSNFFEKTITLDLNSINDLSYNFYANDSYGNGNETTTSTASVSDNDPPTITNILATPNPQEIDGYVNITAEVTDNIGVGNVSLNITYPNSSYENISITSNVSADIYYCNQTYNQYNHHYYIIWANDEHGNEATSSSNSFFMGDYSPPTISNISNTTSSPLDTNPSYGWVNITCTVEDNLEVTQVYLNITNPGGSFNNISMSTSGSNNYYSNESGTFSQYGNYTYLIWSIDNDNNSVSSSSYDFSLPPNYDINMDGNQTVLDLVLISGVYGQSGNNGWIRADVDNNGLIKVLDMIIVSNHYGEVWWV
jgi:hypothetical protein